MYEVIKVLLKLKFLDCKYNGTKILQKFLNISTRQFCSKVFPLDWKKSSIEKINMKNEFTYIWANWKSGILDFWDR